MVCARAIKIIKFLYRLKWDVVYPKTSMSVTNQIGRYCDMLLKRYQSYGHL